MKSKLFILCLVFTCVRGALSINTTDNNSTDSNSTATILNKAEIVQKLAGPNATAPVIVNLKQPPMLQNKWVEWDSKLSMKVLHWQVNYRQNQVIETFEPNELKVKYKFENQPGFTCDVTQNTLEELRNDPLVESIEPDSVLEEHLAQGIPLMNGITYRSIYNGHGIAVAVCDSGIDYNHPKLGGGKFPNKKVIGGYDTGDNDKNPWPSTPFDPHGTSCAGIVAGDLGDVNDYIGGVAYGAKLYALKTKKKSGDITVSTLAAAWDWCTSHRNDDPCNPLLIISTSIGGTRYYSACDSSQGTLANAANNATAAGITIFVSAGNNGYCDSISTPSCLSNVISVGAVYDANFGQWPACLYSASCANPKHADSRCPGGYYVIDQTQADKVTSFSNIASFLDILAPANLNYTTDMVGAAGYSTTDYANDFGGTSAACPYSAGAAACIQSAAKVITGKYLTPRHLLQIMISTGDPITDTKVNITKPRVNLGHAIEYLQNNNCADLTIGTGNLNWAYPFYTYYHDSRTEVIYRASEIGGPGIIKGLAFHVVTIPGQTMNNWTIRMKHTTQNTFSKCSMDASGWTTVYQSNEPRGTTGWPMYIFTNPFNYNGTDNLLVDFSFNNTAYTSNGSVKASTPGGNRSMFSYSDSKNGDPLNWGTTSTPRITCSNYVPNVWFVICPTTSAGLHQKSRTDLIRGTVANSEDEIPVINLNEVAEIANIWIGI